MKTCCFAETDVTTMMEYHSLFGMASEVGEIHGIFQKGYQGHAIDDDKLREELGDLMWMIAEMCYAHRWSLDDIMAMNIEKLRKRYPNGFSKDRSVNRDRYIEG